MDKTTAILIGRYKLTESSLIVHWCSPELGLFKTVAKGALRPKSAFAGRLDLFISSEIRFARAKTGDLHTLAKPNGRTLDCTCAKAMIVCSRRPIWCA